MKKATFRRTLRGELYKLFHHKMFWIALTVGLLLTSLDLVERWQTIREVTQQVIAAQQRGEDAFLGYSVFYSWMGLAGGTYASGLYATLWPLLTTMAFGWSYNQDRFTGLYHQIATRVGIKRYFRAKHTAVFIGGGLVFSLPVLANLLGMALIWPSVGTPAVYDTTFLVELARVSPWGFCLAVCVMYFFWGGATACICHCVGTFLRHSAMVVLVPYAFYVVIDAVLTVCYANMTVNLPVQLSPRILGVVHVINNPGWLQFSYLILFTLGSYLFGLRQVRKNELV